MEQSDSKKSTGLFLVRLWLPTMDVQARWSGRAINILTGRACDFVHPAALGALLIEMMGEARAGNVTDIQIPSNGENNER